MKIYYLCNGFACKDKYNGKCPMKRCRHTSDIKYAINFVKKNNSYFEKEE